MPERVEPVVVGVRWDPNAPDAVMVSRDLAPTTLALLPPPSDEDQRCVVFTWSDCVFSCMRPPNDEAIEGHRLWEKGLQDVSWFGAVRDSELIAGLELENRVHPYHRPQRFLELQHHVLRLQENVVEIVASSLRMNRREGTTLAAAAAAI
ncbi:hypothetical protein [Jatrophihabitans fulvus]